MSRTPPLGRRPSIWFPAIRTKTGAETFTRTLAAGLEQTGYRVHVDWLPHRTEYLPCFSSLACPFRADIVHVNTWLPASLLPKGVPIVATLHHCVQDPAFSPYRNLLQAVYHRFWITPMEREIIGSASRVVAVSHHTAHMAMRIFGRKDVEVIHPGVDTERFRPVSRQGFNSPFRLLYVGGLTRRKGADLLLPIMERLGKGYELFCVGDHRNIFKKGRCGSIFQIGRLKDQADLVRYYQEADALLLPSRLEGFGLAPCEAQACGTPVIATRSSSVPEVVIDGATCILCPMDDVRAFAEAVRLLASDRNLWLDMRAAAASWVRQRFKVEDMVKGYARIYEEVLAEV
ncbi:MAG: glycosyltransferase family 4 protein [Deltaproteobacteria bacterium]